MSDLLNYFLATSEKREAEQDRERACYKLELRQIKERMAEIISQHEPIGDDNHRPRIITIAKYVVYGHKPGSETK